MSNYRYLLFYIIFQQGLFAYANDFFGHGWVPKTLTGEVILLNKNDEPFSKIINGHLPIVVLKDGQGKPLEKIRNGKSYIKVQASEGNSNWVEKRNINFTFAYPLCETFKEKSILWAGGKTRNFKKVKKSGPRNNHNENSSLILKNPVDCEEKFIPGCIQGDAGHWSIAYVESQQTQACNKRPTEAVSGVDCTDCLTEQQRQIGPFSKIALEARRNARAEFTKYVPEDIHELAIETANEERAIAPYLVVQFDPQKFNNYESVGMTARHKDNEEQYSRCKSAIKECHRRKNLKQCSKSLCSENKCSPKKCSPPLCARNDISKLDDWGSCYDNEKDPNDNHEVNIVRKKKGQLKFFTGWCLRGVKETLRKAKMIPPTASLGDGPTKGAGRILESYGFENKMNLFKTNTPPYFDQAQLPPGAVILYNNPDKKDQNGHAEVFTGSHFCSDFCLTVPISKSKPIATHRPDSRHPIAIYIKTKQH